MQQQINYQQFRQRDLAARAKKRAGKPDRAEAAVAVTTTLEAVMRTQKQHERQRAEGNLRALRDQAAYARELRDLNELFRQNWASEASQRGPFHVWAQSQAQQCQNRVRHFERVLERLTHEINALRLQLGHKA